MVATLIAAAIGPLGASAQDMRSDAGAAPAEFPPTSFAGKQYVDSRGCMFIRAGIDGNVTWVPRVTRGRQLICGYQPTFGSQTAATTAAPAPVPAPKPVEITLAPEDRPAPAAAQPRPASQPVAAAPAKASAPAPRRKVASVATAAAPSSRAQQSAAAGPCANASALSQQYINRGPGVRCGPQQDVPVLSARMEASAPSTLQPYTPDTRVVPRHVYDQRQNTDGITVPKGYRPVWSDDRLNPHRAEFSLMPAQIDQPPHVPSGYVATGRGDDRLNTQRGMRTAVGDAQTDMIWTKTVPRRLVPVKTDRPVVAAPAGTLASPTKTEMAVVRLSTRSAPEAGKDAAFEGR
ncbi:sporulation protein [Pseudodonghicola xiamenensis]|uniref:Sporulation protein n=2 Tax=Pseudodonghicola xiamenensis TaxID=337702 RepID=A0A8J3H8S5_9RHOB|nr:sporulation protein [Pseudodonghicola xiamenensis]